MNTVIFIAALMVSGYVGLKAFNLYVKHKMLPVLIRAGEQIVYGGYSVKDLSYVIDELNTIAGKWFSNVRSQEKEAISTLLKIAQDVDEMGWEGRGYDPIDSAFKSLILKLPSLEVHKLGYFCGIERAYQEEMNFRQEREDWDQQYCEETYFPRYGI